MKKKPKPPEYSKYQQWCDAGKPYWTGVALANGVAGFAHLKRTLNGRESPYNQQKLDAFLYEHTRMIPAPVLEAAEVEAVKEAESVATLGTVTPAKTAKVVKLKGGTAVVIDNAISRMGPEVPAAWSESKLVLPDFNTLPDVLKKARIENNERRRKASMLHDQLAEGIEDKHLRQDIIGEIVDLMDMVTASYDMEREWKLHGHAPNLPEDTRSVLERMDLFDLRELITNRINPRRSRWRRQCKLRDGDNLVEATLRMAEAESDWALATEVLKQKTIAHRVAMEQRDREREAKKR